jgi:hypothetical protein
MELVKFTQCASNLNFDPLLNLNPKLIPIAYNYELLNGFSHASSTKVLNYSEDDSKLIDLLKCLHTDLSYIEILNLHVCLERKPQLMAETTAAEFFMHFGLKLDDNLNLTNSLVLKLPKNFLNWCAHKKWGPQDFAPLRAYSDGLTQLTPFLEAINNPLSKNDGTQIFELLVELLMLGKDLRYLLELDLLQWHSALKKERYPMASAQSNKNEELIKKMSWPLHSQPKWIRKGDKSGIELKLFFSHPQELERSLIKLEQLKTKDLWSID